MRNWIVAMLACLAIGLSGCVPASTEDVKTLNNDVDTLMVIIDDIQKDIVVVNDAMKEKAEQGALEQLSAGIEASRSFNPYADEMNAVLLILGTVGGLFAKKKLDSAHREFAREAAKRQADKAGREKTLRELAALSDEGITAALVKNLMYTNIGEARKA